MTTGERLKDFAQKGDIAALKSAIGQGADINNLETGYTPLVWAVVGNQPDTVRWLLDNGATPDARASEKGWTPLMSAVSGQHLDIARMLMDAGASPAIFNKDGPEGKNALQLAREKGNKALLTMLSMTPDEVVFTDTVYDRVVQEVYSFKRKERFTFVRKEEFGDVEAVTRESFADIDKSALRKAFGEHKKRGGKLEESEVFSDMLPKQKAQKGLSLQP